MSTRRGWPATVGELEAVLRHLDIAQGADAQVRDGQLWIRHTPTQPWVAAVRIPAAGWQRTSPQPSRAQPRCQPLPHRAGAVAAPAALILTYASGTGRCDSPL
jgi:hypothetical protein